MCGSRASNAYGRFGRVCGMAKLREVRGDHPGRTAVIGVTMARRRAPPGQLASSARPMGVAQSSVMARMDVEPGVLHPGAASAKLRQVGSHRRSTRFARGTSGGPTVTTRARLAGLLLFAAGVLAVTSGCGGNSGPKTYPVQ